MHPHPPRPRRAAHRAGYLSQNSGRKKKVSANPTLTQRPVKPSDWPSGSSILLTMAPSYLKYFTTLLLVPVHAPAFGKTVISRRIDRFGGSLRTNRQAELAEIE
jgi:hypothetical protein